MPVQPDIESLLKECIFEATRSSGSGGQNVNKVSTKVILLFNVFESVVLNQEQKKLFLEKLHTRISKSGIFRISSERERTQLANRKLVIEKLTLLITRAFAFEEERISTLPTASSRERRIESKKKLSGKKAHRSEKWDIEE